LASNKISKAYVDTTVLTDALLKKYSRAEKAKAALRRFEVTELPQYAIKEFKAGPLKNFTWLHNELAMSRSFAKVCVRLQKMSMSPRRYLTSTALEALTEAANEIRRLTAGKIVEKYGADSDIDTIQAAEYRLAVKRNVFKAWKLRRRLTTRVTDLLTCYSEIDPYESTGGLIEIDPVKCQPKVECCLAPKLKAQPSFLRSLSYAVKSQPDSRENQRRSQALDTLILWPREPLTESSCRSLGDAIFVFFAPTKAVILTTNVRDHKPLASALGKEVQQP